jgi:hypothetical protein
VKSIYAYLKVFDTLNEYWDETKLPDLGSVLSGMNPEPLYETPYLSADPGAYADWSKAWARIVGIRKEGSGEQVFLVAQTFLYYYESEVGYQLGDATNYLASALECENAEGRLAAVG